VDSWGRGIQSQRKGKWGRKGDEKTIDGVDIIIPHNKHVCKCHDELLCTI
jgi:hypothetical protein